MYYQRVEVSTTGQVAAAGVTRLIEQRAVEDEQEIRRMRDDERVRQAEQLIGIDTDQMDDKTGPVRGTSQFVREFDKDVHKGLQASEVEYSEMARRLMAQE